MTTTLLSFEIVNALPSAWISGVQRASVEQTNDARGIECTSQPIAITVGLADRYLACVSGDVHSFLFASYVSREGEARAAIKRYTDISFVPTEMCRSVMGCAYSAYADTLFVPGPEGLTVYRNASMRLALSSGPRGVQYSFGRDKPIQFKTSSPRNGPQRDIDISLSRNGRWLAEEDADVGYKITDTLHLTRRKIVDIDARWPQLRKRITVSEDGLTVALLGDDDDISFVATSHCDAEPLENTVPVCIRSYAYVTSIPPGQKSAYNGRFSADGGEFVYFARMTDDMVYRVILRATRQANDWQPVEYLALGDSFSSGEGEESDSWYIKGTNDEYERCHVSGRAYAYLLGVIWNLTTKSVACSGATMRDIFEESGYSGQKDRLGVGGRNLDRVEMGAAQQEAETFFIPGRVPQMRFIEQYKPALVTVGVGGNDAGFMTKLKGCLPLDTCRWADTMSWRNKVAKEIRALDKPYRELFSTIRRLSPNSRIVAVGYPLPISDNWLCGSEIGVMLNYEERYFLIAAIRYLNDVMRTAALSEGAHFVDTEDAFQGGKLCGAGSISAMNGIRLGDDIAVSVGGLSPRLIGAESFHPTPLGHMLIASRIHVSFSGLHSLQELQPVGGVAPAEPSAYWGDVADINSAPTIIALSYAPQNSVRRGDPITLKLHEGLFAANTAVHVELYSEPTRLTESYASVEGSYIGEFILPSVQEGYHTIVVRGTSGKGEQVEYYDLIHVMGDASTSLRATRDRPADKDGYVSTVTLESTRESERVNDAQGALGDMRLPMGLGEVIVWSGVLGAKDSHNLRQYTFVAIGIIIVTLGVAGYNKCMNIRKIVKRLIPHTVFMKIEPVGHLLEAVIANIRYGFPARKLKIIGVTGTNGKTTTSFMIHRLLHEAGVNVALTTTVGYGVGDSITPQITHMTTSQAGVLQRRLRTFARAGVEWVVVETSSHALAQHRVWGVPYEIAVMTNVTHDHLDYHGTFVNYRRAKQRLFRIANHHGRRLGIINADDPSAGEFRKNIKYALTYGIKAGDVRASKIALGSGGSSFVASVGEDTYNLTVNIPGEFNISNALAAVAVGRELGLTKKQIEKGIAALKAVEGRMNVIDEGQKFKVLVDFASSPDGFEKLFSTVRPLVKGNLIAVFGSAGRRDESKRAVQGRIAGKYADIVVLTEEDDRDDDGARILRQIASGAKKAGKVEGKSLFVQPNREEAIGFAMTLASSANDTVVLLGKGHEKTIERADGEYPWNETEVARTALKELLKGAKKSKK